MKAINEVTRPGDPIIRIKMPNTAINLLKAVAKQNKRRYQDEFIKRLAASFRQNDKVEAFQAKLLVELQKVYTI